MSPKTITTPVLAAAAFLFVMGGGVYGGGWTGAEIIDAGPGYDAGSPDIALDGSGRALAVFVQDDGDDWRVYANFREESAWSGPAIIDAGAGSAASRPRGAMDGSGRAIAVFQQSGGGSDRVYANRWDGADWSGAEVIDAGPGNDAYQPEVAMDGGGNAVVVFEQQVDEFWRIHANFWDGTQWSGAQIIDAGPGNNAFIPAVAMADSGRAVAVFEQWDGENWRIYASVWDGSAWSAAELIDAGPGGNASRPRVATDGSGNAVVVFGQDSGGVLRVYANFWDGTSWNGATTIDAGTGDQADFPAVAMAESGEAVAVFQQKDGSADRIYANRWDTSGWSGAAAIDAGPGFRAYEPRVAMDGEGNALAVFRQSDGYYYRIYSNRLSGASWSGAEIIDAGPGKNADDPRVALDGQGRGVAVFRQYDGSNWRVYANRFFPVFAPWIHDYNGDGTSDIAIFRPSSGLWAVRGVTRVYFGSSGDLIVPADYDGDGTTDIAIFRQASGLWAARGVTRVYFGSSNDIAVPGDYAGDGTAVPAIYRPGSGLWAVRGVTRIYFGGGADVPVPGYYSAGGSKSVGIFRPDSGLWAIRGVTRVYFGSSADTPVPGDYGGEGLWRPAVFRSGSGLWAVRGATRVYFGGTGDRPVPGAYGGGADLTGIFRPASGLWAVRGLTRVYFGGSGDLPAAR